MSKHLQTKFCFSSVGWHLCASYTVSHCSCWGFERGTTTCPCLRSLRQRSQHGVPTREKATPGAGLGSGLLPHQVAYRGQVGIAEQELCVEVSLCSSPLSPLSEGEESWGCPGIDKLVWRESREEWRTSKPVSITFSHQESPLLHSPPLQPAVLELCH